MRVSQAFFSQPATCLFLLFTASFTERSFQCSWSRLSVSSFVGHASGVVPKDSTPSLTSSVCSPVIFREFHGFLKFRRVARVESAFAEAVRSVVSACSSVIVEVTVIPPHVALGLFSISHQKRLGSSHCAFILQRKKNKTQRLKAAPPPCHPKAVFADAPGWPARCRRLVDVKLSETRFWLGDLTMGARHCAPRVHPVLPI